MHYVENRFNDEVKHNERSVCGGRQGASREKLSKANSKHIIRCIQCTYTATHYTQWLFQTCIAKFEIPFFLQIQHENNKLYRIFGG